MALLSPLEMLSVRFHWPIQGPHAFARTIPPASSKVESVESRSSVARICSLPGVTKKSITGFKPAAVACFTRSSARAMSWYELFVQLPISPADTVSGQLFYLTAFAKTDSGVDRSGVKGPLIWGSNSERLISTTRSYLASGSARRMCAYPSATLATSIK